MKLSEAATEAIKNNFDLRMNLAKALRFSEGWILTLSYRNKENGPLTSAKALQVIRKELRLADQEILVDEEVSTT